MKRLLVLSYYFPPLGMSGVQRVLKLVKYLPRFGWQPVVVTPGFTGTYAYDQDLLAEAAAPVFRTFSLDPLFLSPQKHDAGLAARRGFLAWLNHWFIPDNKIGWIPFAVRAGMRAAQRYPIDAILSSAPPYSSHLAGVILKRALGKPLVSDFRDSWTNYTWVSYPTRFHRYYDQAL
ncbi:MAG: glycosyl transferase family 1, partial [Candidatus Edwardsbacteria bacterium]|nr:glycosyl transferase family 1 [Candidatus Edwardsbacteria bacterium]